MKIQILKTNKFMKKMMTIITFKMFLGSKRPDELAY